ncbi:unnamed protein product [Caenorhabditis angaria]|uniref:F-box domain-containing protein n=1 Tax=Caenorhabditis angaria TaxID=860376 RepID=A0A9P1I7E0_9PELO|nr:unnamed protein product [Caenorhabditis angaria]
MFSNLPPEIRLLIIDKLEPDDRAELKKCSKQCWRDVRSSKNEKTCLGLEWESRTENEIELTFYTDGFRKAQVLRICQDLEDDRRIFGAITTNYTEIQSILEFSKNHQSINLVEFAKTKFLKKLEKSHENLRKLSIFQGAWHKNIDFFDGCKMLSKLEDLKLSGAADGKMPRFGANLKNLMTSQFCSQIFEVTQSLDIDFELDFEEFLKLSATKIYMPIGKLSAENIFEFLKLCENGQRKLEKCEFFGLRKEFERKFLELLRNRKLSENENHQNLEIAPE